MKEIIQRATEKNEKVLTKIIQLRQEKHYSREEIATQLGIDTSTYTRIENGQIHLRLKTLMVLAEILETTFVIN